ncbi:MAG: DUF4238 domain-containing protein [Nitrospirales bacterium]
MNATRHHFVPQGYLRGFSIPEEGSRNFVWVYDKRSGRTPRKKAVRSIAWAPAYYAQEREDGSTDFDTLENLLGRTIDNEAPEIIRKISAEIGCITKLSEEERATLAFFVGLSLTRVPSFRDGINDFHTKVAGHAFRLVAPQVPYKPEALNLDDVVVTAKSWVSLQPMIGVAQNVADSALTKTWQFFVPPDGVALVTSDNPVVFSGASIGVNKIGPAHPGAELLMNLRSDLALVCTPKRGYPNKNTFRLSASEARKFNRGVVRAARYRVFANHLSPKLEGFVKKYSGEEQRVVM